MHVCVCVLVYCVYATQKCIEKTKTKIFVGSVEGDGGWKMGKRMLGQLAHLHNVVGSLKLISTTILESKMCRYARDGGGVKE